jgi:hypothetical protein
MQVSDTHFSEIPVVGGASRERCPDRIRTRVKGQRKSPTALAAGLEFLFFSKEVTANWITGDRVFFYYYWIRIFLFLLLFFFWRLNPVCGR